MGLLSRLRAWIAGTAGDDESAASSTDSEGAATAEDGESAGGDEATGLDPSAATETRTAATDDAVDALRDVRRSQEAAPADGDADSHGDVDPDEAADSDSDGDPGDPDGADRDAS
ncbi:hypothetical protein ACFQMF_00625 [Halorubrum rutilum]|uniref:Uncharacterized protein n=1 Tax=Halorubrum rutilum TaxID=1364933 RepID=A0ABD6AFP4_9EURY|nr:hypothetical protein [Halorubrum rutilum]